MAMVENVGGGEEGQTGGVENKARPVVVWRRRPDVTFIYSRIVELAFFG
jgi:hypothetical protein